MQTENTRFSMAQGGREYLAGEPARFTAGKSRRVSLEMLAKADRGKDVGEFSGR